MKKILSIVLAGLMVVNLACCGQQSPGADGSGSSLSESSVGSETSAGEDASSADEDASSADEGASSAQDEATPAQDGEMPADDVQGESIEITIPSAFVEEGTTQESLDADKAESGFTSAVLNEDGSVTYKMSEETHRKMMESIKANLTQSLNAMVGSEGYPSFEQVTANDDYTEFTVSVSSSELGLSESMSVLAFFMLGGLYHAFNGTEPDDIAVSFVNAETGEVIHQAHSSELGE